MKTGPRCTDCLGLYCLAEAGAKSDCAECRCDYVENRTREDVPLGTLWAVENRTWEEVPFGTLWITDGEHLSGDIGWRCMVCLGVMRMRFDVSIDDYACDDCDASDSMRVSLNNGETFDAFIKGCLWCTDGVKL